MGFDVARPSVKMAGMEQITEVSGGEALSKVPTIEIPGTVCDLGMVACNLKWCIGGNTCDKAGICLYNDADGQDN